MLKAWQALLENPDVTRKNGRVFKPTNAALRLLGHLHKVKDVLGTFWDVFELERGDAMGRGKFSETFGCVDILAIHIQIIDHILIHVVIIYKDRLTEL